MYTMNPDNRPKKPVITSLASAVAEVERWLTENCYDRMRDADGLTWRLSISIEQIHDPKDPKGLLWEAALKLMAEPTADELVESGILDRKTDQRLIGLIGDSRVRLARRPLTHRARSEEEMKTKLATALPELRTELEKNSSINTKRSLLGRWIDAKCSFGGSSA